MFKIAVVFMAILCVAYLAFMWGYILGDENRNDPINWSAGWDDGYKAGQKTERNRQCREELRKSFGTDGGE